MSEVARYPKRLIEVDLPIKRISAHSRREKSIRHGHISTLHIWWARRPLAACRAVICAALWPDPADELCPESFRHVARAQMQVWAEKYCRLLGPESMDIHFAPAPLEPCPGPSCSSFPSVEQLIRNPARANSRQHSTRQFHCCSKGLPKATVIGYICG
jgi:adenine-specific DNA methylase